MNDEIYLTTEEVAPRIKYDCRASRDRVKDSVLIEGKHYFRPFGGRKILYIWSAIERDMKVGSTTQPDSIKTAGIPMASGGFCNV
jgi:hypothetical protein